MKSLFRLVLCAATLVAIGGCRTAEKVAKRFSEPHCSYIVDASKPETGTLTVTMQYHGVEFGEEAIFCLPAWAPGAYQFLEYGRFVKAIYPIAENGDTLPHSSLHSSMWIIQKAKRLKKIRYVVGETTELASDVLWVERTEINSNRVYFNGTNVFAYIDGFKRLPCEVRYELPQGWRVASAIEIAPNSTEAVAQDYDELVDAPVLMGKFDRSESLILGKPHSFVIDSDEPFRPDSLVKVTEEIVKAHYRLFGELPYSKYVFLFRLVRPKFLSSYGALEHRNSSAYFMPVGDWRKVRSDQLTNTISHEFFHLWNPKRIHGELLGGKENGGFDYQNRIFTPNIWFVEGVTDYYADALLVRNGIISPQAFLDGLWQRISHLKMFPSEREESLEALSLRLASVESSDEMIPFYVKGTLVAMMLDIELRLLSGDRFSLDSLLVKMNETYGKPQKSYPEDSLIYVIQSLSGADVTPFYAKFIIGTDSLDLQSYFAKIGLELTTREEETPFSGYLALPDSSDNFIVGFVMPGSEAAKMGVQSGDEIVAIDGIDKTRKEEFAQRVMFYEGQRIGDSTTVVVARGDKRLTLRGKVGGRKIKRQALVISPKPSDAARWRRMEMFGF
ncbi:MAG: PDZ domain-containing protein [Chloroherpetonaceae bacterium]|nr:PDZ domain-containing protein [Chloroherpetonaceae bacterium]MDW8436531.1 PDZ domain-containing protein [Chloroherpetonaceae bacterium]